MIPLSAEETAAIADRFEWFKALSDDPPDALAAIDGSSSRALHFAEGKAVTTLPSAAG